MPSGWSSFVDSFFVSFVIYIKEQQLISQVTFSTQIPVDSLKMSSMYNHMMM